MATSNEIARPATSVVKPNLDVPKGVRVERQPSGAVNSPNPAGGYVAPDRLNPQSK
jgi:hypothetical protein